MQITSQTDPRVDQAAVLWATLIEDKHEFKNGTVQVKLQPGSFNLLLAVLEGIHQMDAEELEHYRERVRTIR